MAYNRVEVSQNELKAQQAVLQKTNVNIFLKEDSNIKDQLVPDNPKLSILDGKVEPLASGEKEITY